MTYNEKAARRLEEMYRGHDVVAQRLATVERLQLQPGEAVLDIGSGPGFLAEHMAEQVGPTGRVCGVDYSPVLVDRAGARNAFEWLSYKEGDAAALPVEDASFDVVVSVQVAEFVEETSAFCTEAFRALKPGGRGLIIATDWDAISWFSDDPERMRRVLKAFEPHCPHTSLPKTLVPYLRAAGFQLIDIGTYPIINFRDDPADYSRQMALNIGGFAKQTGAVPATVVDAWLAELSELATAGRYYFLSNRVIFMVRRPST